MNQEVLQLVKKLIQKYEFNLTNTQRKNLHLDEEYTRLKEIIDEYEKGIIVTFSCNNAIHCYTGLTGTKPLSPYKTHHSIEDAKKYLKEKRGVEDAVVLEK